MRGRIILPTALLMIGGIIANLGAEEIKLHPLDFSHPAVKAAIARQKAMASGEMDLGWGQLSKKTQELLGPDGFRELRLSTEGKNRSALISKADLTGIRPISDNRVWVEANVRDLPAFKGFYFIKEDGVWKFDNIDRYLKQAETDLTSLTNSINDYYKKNNKLPASLAEVSRDVPVDLFSDSDAPYQYKVLSNSTYILYSLGPDSDDDNGLIAYSRKEHPISDGDIVRRGSF